MITVNGRLVAAIVLLAALAVIAAMSVIGAVSNRVTGHEALIVFIALMVAAAAGLWLRRDKRTGGKP